MEPDFLFLAKERREGALTGTVYSSDGKAVYQGGFNPRDVREGDVIAVCGKVQKDDQMGRACKMLRDLIGGLTQMENAAQGGNIKWCYNRFGHVELWKTPEGAGEADLYLQVDTDVESFLKGIGLDPDDVYPGDCDITADPGYFL